MRLFINLVVFCAVVFWSPGLLTGAQASVVMVGTRVIYTEGEHGKTLQLNNNDAFPYLVQMWVDKGKGTNSVDHANAPFALTPQIFRIESNSGQTLRMVFTGADLLKDRESLFYLNFVQVPSTQLDTQNQNKFVLIVNNRIKVFYRPKHLTGNVDDLGHEVRVKREDADKISITNPTGYFVNLRDAEFTVNGRTIIFAHGMIVSPKSTKILALPKASHIAKLTLKIVNDYGADVANNYSL